MNLNGVTLVIASHNEGKVRDAVGFPITLADEKEAKEAGFAIGYLTFGGGLLASVGICAWIARKSTAAFALRLVAVRMVQLLVSVVRIYVVFLAIAVPVGMSEATVFLIANPLGTSMSIVPAGIGISEGIGAALAVLVSVPSAAAFLALALNRVLGLACCGGILAAYAFQKTRI